MAFGKTGEFIEKYGTKGTKFLIEGRIQTGSYEKASQKIYTTDVIVERVEFAESKKASNSGDTFGQGFNQGAAGDPGDGFMNIPDGIDEELPFN